VHLGQFRGWWWTRVRRWMREGGWWGPVEPAVTWWVRHRNCACNILGNSSQWQCLARDWPAMEIPRKVVLFEETWGDVTARLCHWPHVRDYHNSLDGASSAWSCSRRNAFNTGLILVGWCYHMSSLGRHWFQIRLKSGKSKFGHQQKKSNLPWWNSSCGMNLFLLPSLPFDTFTPPAAIM